MGAISSSVSPAGIYKKVTKGSALENGPCRGLWVGTANSGCVLIDTDSFPLQADNVHYTGAGMKSLGTAFYNAVTW